MRDKEEELVHKLEKLHQYLSGAHSVCDHDNSSATFHQVAHAVQELILWIRLPQESLIITKTKE